MKNASERIVRKARGAGRWYPGDRGELAAMVNGCIEQAKVPKIPGRIVAAIAPHAGYVYSGPVAGYTFRALRENLAGGRTPDTVVVLGFSHSAGFAGVALMDGDALLTPLGEAALDTDAVKTLTGSSSRIVANTALHGAEHSAENQVPFVQVAFPKARIVVGLIGDHDPRTLDDLARALGALAKTRRIIVVASTDMLHDPDYDLVTRTDKATLEKLAALDSDGIVRSWAPDRQVFCGLTPVLTVMKFAAAQGSKQGTVLYYRNNGDDDPSSRGRWVVGYGAAVFAVPD